MSGSNTITVIKLGGQSGIYGTLGVASASNVPGGREGSVSWTDSSGNFWLFGGQGYDSTGTLGFGLNDLWEFSPTTKMWTWVSGSDTVPGANGSQPGVYGTQGVPAAANVPGGRFGAVSWTDSSGNLWLFGGNGQDAPNGLLNDLWEFSPTTKMWTWMSGSNTGSTPGGNGVYGTLGVPAPSNVPGAREAAASWTDNSGNFWLFGGSALNDLWEFSPATEMWTWVSGSSSVNGVPDCLPGVYGTKVVPAASNVPAGRGQTSQNSASWTDSSGNLWLFGGFGCAGSLNDLWEFNPTTNEWTWMSGSSTANAVGVYGTMGVAAPSNVPGGRASAVGWIDSDGDLWLFGGGDQFNDLWEFNRTTNEWTWMSGSDTGNASGIYGTLGAASANNVPGGRESSVSWIDSSGNLWLFGGLSYDSTGTVGYLNDLWRYQP
ncbi:MAG: kelch repeat-containing protein [Terriglobales bacterium]